MMILARRIDKPIRFNAFSNVMLTITTLIAIAYIYANIANLIQKL
jgi:hypothetical protein